jgi:RNA polymerase sigma-70 factor (ECF subfamily)
MAFNHLYRKYVPSLFNFGCQFTQDQACVQDCIQNLFIDLRRRRERLGEVQSIKSYLYKSLYHELLRKLEKDKKMIWQEDGVDEKYFGVEMSVEEKMITHELSEEIRMQLEQLLNGLTVRQKKAMLLFYAEGFSYAEVAEAMDLKNPKQARKLIYRALEMAKKGAETLQKGMGKLLATVLVICFL